MFNLSLSIYTISVPPRTALNTAVGTVVVADTLPAVGNLPHQAAVEDTLPEAAAGTDPVRPVAEPGGRHHVYFHPACRHTTRPHASCQSGCLPPASAGSLVPSRPAVLLGILPGFADRTAGAVAAVRTRQGLGAGLRTGAGPGRRTAVVVVAGTAAAAAGSCSLCFVGARRRKAVGAGRCCTCYHFRISSLVPGRRTRVSTTMSHQGCTKGAVPVLGNCPVDRYQSIHTRPVLAVHATRTISARSCD